MGVKMNKGVPLQRQMLGPDGLVDVGQYIMMVLFCKCAKAGDKRDK